MVVDPQRNEEYKLFNSQIPKLLQVWDLDFLFIFKTKPGKIKF
jgi:hypothetical protein